MYICITINVATRYIIYTYKYISIIKKCSNNYNQQHYHYKIRNNSYKSYI